METLVKGRQEGVEGDDDSQIFLYLKELSFSPS